MTQCLPFSKSWSWRQNKMQPCFQGVSLNDRGFRYGQHLFETMAVREGRVLFFDEHWKKLQAAAQRHSFPFFEKWHDGMSAFLEKQNFEDGLLRIFLTAGEGAPGSPIVAPELFIFWEHCDFPSQEKIKKGINIISLNQPIGTSCWGEKIGNYWKHLTALEMARQAGAEEGLIFDADGFLISAAMANVILCFDDEKIITPPFHRGAREGVMLGWVRQQIPALIEADVTRDDLKKVRAMALTNSRIGVMPVAALDQKMLVLPFFNFTMATC